MQSRKPVIQSKTEDKIHHKHQACKCNTLCNLETFAQFNK